MLRKYYKEERGNKKERNLFFNENGEPINQYVIRSHFRKYRRKTKLDEKVTYINCQEGMYKNLNLFMYNFVHG